MSTDITELLEEARANVSNAAESMPPGNVRAALLRGEGADDRLSLIVRLADALEALLPREDADLDAIEALHVERIDYVDNVPDGGSGYCLEDGDDWPCQTATLLARVRTAEANSQRYRDQALAAEEETRSWRHRAQVAYRVYTAAEPEARAEEETEEWAVEERTDLDGPWDHIDDGRGWSHRRQVPYTEAEARALAARSFNGIDPAAWRRVVRRTVTPYKPAPITEEN